MPVLPRFAEVFLVLQDFHIKLHVHLWDNTVDQKSITNIYQKYAFTDKLLWQTKVY